jgi:hypothetical protein
MAAGTSINKLRGRIILGEPNILSNWKGRIYVRALPRKIDQIKSERRGAINALIAMLAPRWSSVLLDADRQRWEEYANLLGSAIDADKQDLALGSHNVIPQHKTLMSGFNAYIRANLLAFAAGLPYPKDVAPLGDPVPTSPSNIGLTYAGGTATVTWTNPVLPSTPPIAEKKVLIWAEIQSKGKIHPQIVAAIDISVTPPPETYDFTALRGGGGFGGVLVSIGDMTAGLLRVQLATTIAVTTVRGCISSPPSIVKEVPITI